MPWAKVDDKLHGHPKAAEAGLEALGLHLLAMSYVAAYETDGHVSRFPTEKAGAAAERLVANLLDAGLWGMSGDGWIIRDWWEYIDYGHREPISQRTRRRIFERDGGICQICQLPVDGRFHIDHRHPVALGGGADDWNLQLAHPSCNLRKGARR